MRSLLGVILLASAAVADPMADKGTGACAGMTNAECIKLATRFEYGVEGQPKDRKKAYAMYVAACGAKISVACTSAGERAKDAGLDEATTRRWYQKGCDLDGSMCVSYGFYLTDQDAPADVKQGVALLAKACDDGWGLACNTVAEHAASETEAAAWQKKQCTTKDSADCSRYIQRVFRERAGLDAKTTTTTLEYWCTQGYGQACDFAAVRHFEGKGAKKSDADAQTWWAKGCDVGEARLCIQIARRALFDKNDKVRAAAFFDKACKLEDKDGCEWLERVKKK